MSKSCSLTCSVFLHGSHQFELDTYAAPQSGLRLLAVEVESAQQQLEMPSFLTGLRDVSGDEAFRASSISRAS
jgi:CYTH domain-containing protein